MSIKTSINLLLFTLLLFGCKNESNKENGFKPNKAEEIIDQTYVASGSNKLENSELQFQFRNRIYRAYRNDGKFKLEREFQDSIGLIRDSYTNTGFERFIDNERVNVPDSMAFRYRESVNSVHYFSVLPYGLKDEAVNATYLDQVTINDQNYHKLEIRFDEEGGGQDYEDVFIYWINTETQLIDYLAYEFNVNGGGMRFREAFNERLINGVRIADYRNYKPIEEGVDLRELDQQFASGNLALLSAIELRDVTLTF